jgi:hypothetical protein
MEDCLEDFGKAKRSSRPETVGREQPLMAVKHRPPERGG